VYLDDRCKGGTFLFLIVLQHRPRPRSAIESSPVITSIPSSDPVDEREQISGWLLVFVVIQIVQWIGVIRGLMATPASFTLAERHLQAAVPAYLAFLLFDNASLLVEAVVPVVGLFWLFRRSGRAPILFKTYLAFLIVAGVIRSVALPVLYPVIAEAF